MGAGSQLGDAFLLRLVDRQQAVKDLGITLARVLVLNQLNQGPQRGFPVVRGQRPIAPQTFPESFTEPELGLRRYIFAVQIIVAVRIEEAVTQD